MKVFELHWPRTWLDGVTDSHVVLTLLHLLETRLADASVGLALFEEARARPRQQPGWMRRQAAAQAIAQSMDRGLPHDMTPQEQFEARSSIPEAADLHVRRQEWAAGQMPEGYEQRLVFIHAHTVLYALDAVGKTLDRLAEMSDVPAQVAVARDLYRAALPDLVDVRDSAHHTEDRGRGRGKFNRPLTMQPIDNRLINAPSGGQGSGVFGTYGGLARYAGDGGARAVCGHGHAT